MVSKVVDSKLCNSTVSRQTISVALAHIIVAVHGMIRGFVMQNNKNIQHDKKLLDDWWMSDSDQPIEDLKLSTELDPGLPFLIIIILIHLVLGLTLLAGTTNASLAYLQTWLFMEATSTVLDTGFVVLAGINHGTTMILAILLVRPFCFYVVHRRIKDIKMSSQDDTVQILPHDAEPGNV